LKLEMNLPVLEPASRPAGFDSGPRSIEAVRVLRISVTDRCNFRCVYCMPEEGVAWLPKSDILTYEEIEQVVRAAIDIHGIRRFKLTGGEPTVRHGLIDLVRRLRSIDGIEDLSLTTNGMLLEQLAQPLREAGLDRITISLDTLRPDRFRQITRTGDLATVLRGLDAVERAGFASTKINFVVMRGTNEDEVAEVARLTIHRPITVRFIEYMPLGDAAIMHSDLSVHASERGPAGGCGAQDRGENALVPEQEVHQRIEDELGELIPVDRRTEPGVGPAKVYRLATRNAHPATLPGRIGFISAMSAPFCDTCNRLRLTADGVLRSCLFEGGEVDVRSILRAGGSPQHRRRRLAAAMVECVRLKPDVHSHHGNQQMSRIGG
jgi:GTP 3',8-cyclase